MESAGKTRLLLVKPELRSPFTCLVGLIAAGVVGWWFDQSAVPPELPPVSQVEPAVPRGLKAFETAPLFGTEEGFKLVEDNPLFVQYGLSLGNMKDEHRLFVASTKLLKGYVPTGRVSAFTCKISSTDSKHGLVLILARKQVIGGRAYYLTLPGREDLVFTVPEGGGEDSLVAVGRLERRDGAPLTKNPGDFLRLEVSQP